MSVFGIKDIAVYLPERVVTNDELVAQHGFDSTFLEQKLGIRERRIAAPGETTSELAEKAMQSLFDRNPQLRASDVELLICCTQNADFRLPHIAAILQHRLGLPNHAACFDMNLGCSGFVYSLGTATAFMQTHGYRSGLVVTADPYSRILDRSDRTTTPLFGDAAAATWIGDQAGNTIGRFTFGTDGSGFEHLICPHGPDIPLDPIPNNPSASDSAGSRAVLKMNGRAIFEFVLKTIPADVAQCLEMNQLQKEDVDYFIFHQASAYLVDYLRRKLDIDSQRVPICLEKTGNTVSSSIPLCLHELCLKKELGGATIMLTGFGVGLSWASTVIRYELCEA